MAEIKSNDRVSIDNLVNWDLHFAGIESTKDLVVRASVRDWKQLTVAEIDAQVKAGNGFFCGTDGFGTNAYIKIPSDEVREYIFGAGETGEVQKQKVLDLETVVELLAVTPKAKFEAKLKEIVVTEAEKKMIVPLAKEAGVDDVESYKMALIEKHSGIDFSE